MVLHLASPQLCDCLGNKAHHPIVNANKILALHGGDSFPRRDYVSTYRRSREEESPVRGYDDQEYRNRLRERDSWRRAEPRNVYYRSPSPQPRDRSYVSTYRRSREEESPVRGYDDQEYRQRLRERDSWRHAEPRNVYYRNPSPQPRDRSLPQFGGDRLPSRQSRDAPPQVLRRLYPS